MNEETKKKINAKYERELNSGERFWPDSIYKDVVVSLGIFLLLLLLATFIGVHDTPKADPSDTSYVPRPEWYFLFLFQMLKIFPAKILFVKGETVAVLLIFIGVLFFFFLPLIDKRPAERRGKAITAAAFLFILFALIMSVWSLM